MKPVPREVARFIQSRLGELKISEARYKDLLSEADEQYPKYCLSHIIAKDCKIHACLGCNLGCKILKTMTPHKVRKLLLIRVKRLSKFDDSKVVVREWINMIKCPLCDYEGEHILLKTWRYSLGMFTSTNAPNVVVNSDIKLILGTSVKVIQ